MKNTLFLKAILKYLLKIRFLNKKKIIQIKFKLNKLNFRMKKSKKISEINQKALV